MTFKILFASSEIYPLVKTGGLADVSQSLPTALKQIGHDVRLIMPAYRQAKLKFNKLASIAEFKIYNYSFDIAETVLPESEIPLYLVDCPDLYDRNGGLYVDEQGNPWPDNAARFAYFCRVISKLASCTGYTDWLPDILHCNDWHTGLACPLLSYEDRKPKTVFTIHNLAYQGLFSQQTFNDLQLPEELWRYDRLEFNNQLSFIKAGIVYADHVNTVSSTYAKEIQTAEYGCGLEEVLRYYSSKLSGIVNGINTEEWNPQTDHFIKHKYSKNNINHKSKNKTALQAALNLQPTTEKPLYSVISRIAEQKGIDLIIKIIPEIVSQGAQIVILGTGDKALESDLTALSNQYDDHVAVKIGFDEKLAHMITASADFFLMPSRYEPCGLNQMYSQRYGTIPIVRNTGGLADTVINYLDDKNKNSSTGFIFDKASSENLLNAISISLKLYSSKSELKNIQTNAMNQDFSWQKSALEYLKIYKAT